MHTPLLASRLSRWLVVWLLTLLSTSGAWAQSTANYAFTTSSTGSLVDMSSGTTDALATGTYRDDDASAVLPIGFTFGFMGSTYSQFSVNSNGQLRLGTTVITGGDIPPASGSPILAPFGGDNAIQATGKVHYKVIPGTNRLLVVEWNSLRIPYSSTVGTGSLVQATLEENTGKIEYRYGAMFNNGTAVSRSIFISAGTSAGQIGVVKTFNATPTYDATVTAATATTLVNTAAIAVLNSTADGARTVFTFTPPATAPAAPAITLSAVTVNSLTVNITDNSTNEYTFTVYRSTDNITFTQSGAVTTSSTSGTGTTVTVAQTGLAPSTLYYYRVTANSEGVLSTPATATATTLALVPICGTKSVGPGAGADYPTLTAAFGIINVNGVCGPLVLELQAAYVSTTETFPLVYSNATGSATNTVTVRPAAGATNLSITSTVAGAAFNIFGGKYLIVDGRPGGSGSPVSGAALATDLTIASTSTTGIPLQFTSDAVFNTVQHTQVVGVGNNVSSYPNVNFTGTVTALGNSDNTLQYNNITAGATTPVSLLYSGNSLNSRNNIVGNNFSNFYLTGGSAYGININSAGTGWVISGNSIYQTVSRVSTGGTLFGMNIVGGGGYTITNNFIGGSAPNAGGTALTATGTAATFRFAGIFLTLSGAVSSVQGNTVANINWITSSGAATTYGNVSGIYISAGDANIGTTTGNTIGTVAGPITVSSSTTGGYTFGISSASSGTVNISGNTISNITGVGSTATVASNVAGILVSAGASNTISRNKIYTLAAGSGVANLSTGIWLVGGTTNNVSNNLIGDLRATTSTSLVAVSGILVAGGTTNNVAFNTIRIDGTSTATTFGTQGIYLNSLTAGLNLYNNIVINLSTPVGTGGSATAIRRISGTAGTVPSNLFGNNNLYYTGTPSATNLIYVEGTTTATNAQQTLAAYKAFLLNREANSVTETATPFISTTGTDATFLHITAGAATQAESAGQAFNGITTDFDGDTRNATTPDIGADEGSFLLTDQTGPVIVVTAITGSLASTISRTLTATITDVSGIATGANGPRLYFRKNGTGAFVPSAAPTVSGSTYTFIIDYSLLGGAVPGDVISYYIAAQDALGNTSTNPTGGNGGTTAPAVVYNYTIIPTLNGTYYVGTSTSPDPTRTFATLTAAANGYSNYPLAGPVTFLLLDPTYSAATGETFPVAFFNSPDASATNTLTIRPNTGVSSTVTAAGSTLVLASSRYITIDGSNTVGGTTRNLTLVNSVLTANNYVLGLVLQTGQPVSNQFTTIRNVNLTGGGATSNVNYGILLSGADNDNVTLQNNNILGVSYGIQAFGTALVSAGGLDNLVVSGNVVGPPTATTGANINIRGILISSAVAPMVINNTVQNVTSANALLGLQVQNASTATVTNNSVLSIVSTAGGVTGLGLFGLTGATVSQNLVQGITSNSSTALSGGLVVGSGNTGLVIDRNRMLGLTEVNTGGNGIKGIEVQSGTANANIRISNNFVQVAAASGYSITDYANQGIRLSGTQSGISLYYNSVNMTGTETFNIASFSTGLTVLSGSTGIDVRNNIFRNSIVNSGNTSAKAYAFYSTAPASAFTNLNYNDYFVAGTQGVLAYFSADVTTLAALRTATGQDANSVNVDPAFVSTTDLHTAAAALNGAATPIAAVTVDIDGETRSSTTPDIGADEFVTNLDISVAALTAPVTNSTCFTATEVVSASITNASTVALNFATNPVTVTVTITSTVAGSTPQVFTTVVNTGTLAAGASQTVTLPGTIDLSVLGTYTATVTTTLVGDDNPANNVLAPVTITSATRSAAFTYPAATTYCAGSTSTITPTLATGATAGTFASTTGLTISATTGVITLATSTAGTYNVTNTLPATATCPATVVTQVVTITPGTTATFSYTGSPFCKTTTTSPTPVVTGTAGGTFTSTTGLTISATTGAITLSSSTAGTYVVTYSVAGACASSSTQTIVITNAPTAAFSYPTGTICTGQTAVVTPTITGTAGTFTSTTGLTISATTGVITPSTSTAGTYIVTNTVAASGTCAAVTSTATVILTPGATATFSYAGSPFCTTATTAVTPTITGTTGGTFASTTGLTISATTGAITPSTSTAGTYVVTYSVAGTCPSSSTQTIVITNAPTAAFSYPTAAICAGQTATVAPVLSTGGSSGTFTSTTGLTISATTGVITPSTSTAGTYTVTNTVAASGTCAAVTSTATVVITPATTATFSYTGSPFCRSVATAVTPTVTGTAGGTFTSTTGLTISATTGAITPSTSTAGTYVVTYSVSGTCPSSSTQTVVITNAPVATFTYPTGTICAGQTATVTPTITGTAGTFTSTTGLTISATTGVITPSTSTAGNYTVTNTIAAAGGCAAVTSTQSVTILPVAVATFSYGTASTFCVSGTTAPTVVLGTGATAGTFTSTTGLTISATTGAITLASSTPGTYVVTNTVAASGSACGNTATSTVNITAAPVATFSYGTTTTYCVSGTTNPAVTLGTGATAGTFTSTAGLTISATTGAITLASSTPGVYTVTNTIAAAGGCSAATATSSVTITAAPVATFSYGTASTFCVSGTTAPTVVLGTGATAGTFTSTTGLTISATTGAITLASSTPGTYVVTNTIAAASGCSAATATSTVTITAAPLATFSYPTANTCVGSATPLTPTLGTGATAGVFTSTTGLTINATTGVVTLATSTAGTYTVTNSVAAAGGCAAATATATITVNPRPATPTLTVVNNGVTATLTSSAATGNQFYLNNVAITGATNTTYVVTGSPAQLGSYTVTTTNANGCVSLPSNVQLVTAAKSGIAGASLKLYPNPTPTGEVTLELTGYRSVTQLTVLDALGRVVRTETLPANAGTAVHTLNLTSVATGVYLLRLSNADGVQTQRITRE